MLHAVWESEDSILVPYAMHNAAHGARLYEEEDPPYRTAFQRDRDRIIHSKAFRRLGYKTQVFVNSEGDNYRTRLTHSIEVSQISRSVAGALLLNRDYAEALALAHDLGHAPFGHSGQDALHKLMVDSGGFEHNRQSLRIVSRLEQRYPEFPGLNLTRATLSGIMKHKSIYDCDEDLREIMVAQAGRQPYLEAMIVDLCDRIAYVHHDIEDGLDANILSSEELMEIDAWKQAYMRTEKKFGESFRHMRNPLRLRSVIRHLINRCINDLIESSAARLCQIKLESADDARKIEINSYPIRLSQEMHEILSIFHKFLHKKMYRNSRVMQMSHRGEKIIETLFKEYRLCPNMLPTHFQEQARQEGLERTVCDYISGMTDRFALKEYRYMTGMET